jgi:adenosylcobinamide-GDP ribazoletransferase
MPERARAALAALSFLTAVPVGRRAQIGEGELRRGVVLFPVVGAALGAVVALVAWGTSLVVPPLAAAVLGVAAGVGATAALHVDGLGDVADGVGASLTGRDPGEVMRDPRLGTFGVAAVALDLLLKGSLLATLVADGFPWAVVAAGALSRTGAVALAWRLPYVGCRSGGWIRSVGPGATATAAAIALTIGIPSAGFATAGMVVAVAVVAGTTAWWSRRRLGGVTGDGLGAAIELGETLALGAAVAMS